MWNLFIDTLCSKGTMRYSHLSIKGYRLWSFTTETLLYKWRLIRDLLWWWRPVSRKRKWFSIPHCFAIILNFKTRRWEFRVWFQATFVRFVMRRFEWEDLESSRVFYSKVNFYQHQLYYSSWEFFSLREFCFQKENKNLCFFNLAISTLLCICL